MEDISVLIVEDDSNVSSALVQRFRRTFPNVFTAHNGLDGVEAALREKPTIIITDLRMPHMGGFEMITKIRETMPDVHVIVLTASCEKIDMQKADQLGISAYFTKPLMVKKLIEKVEELGGR